MVHVPRDTSRCTPTSKPTPGAGVAPSWIGTAHCGSRSSPGSSRGGLRSRCPGAWLWIQASGSSPTRPSTGSYTPNWSGRRTTPGATTCLAGSLRGRRGGNPASFIHLRRPVAERPQGADDRQTPGHWEADLMLFRTYGQAILTLHERHSRLLIALRPQGKASDPIALAMARVLAPLPPEWRQTVTFDNGTEFARHHQLHDLGIQTFFCDTHSPWQKGGVENAIGRMRRTLPRKTDLADISDGRFTQLVQAYNNTPRKCLGYRTPAEIFHSQVLHLKCESICPRTRARRGSTG